MNVLLRPLLGLGCFCLLLACTAVPLSIDALMQRGMEQYQAGELDASVASFEEVIAREPTRVLAYVYIARSLLAQARFAPAIERAKAALELAPGDPEVLATLLRSLFEGGQDALRSGDFRTAVEYLAEFVAREPYAVDGYLGLARAYLGAEDPVQAGQTLLQGLGAVEGEVQALLPLLLDAGTGALGQGDAKAAIDLLGSYIQQQAENPEAFVALARAYLADGSLFQALSAARKALQLNPDDSGAASLLRSLTP